MTDFGPNRGMTDEEKIRVLSDWLNGREEIWPLVERFPPFAKVMAKEGHGFLVPAPGIVGQINSYFEDGTVSVVAPMQVGVKSYITGAEVRPGELIAGQCAADALELLECDEFEQRHVRRAITQLS